MKKDAKFTSRKWQECRVFLKTAFLIQEMLGVEGPGSFPLISFQHRVQQRYDHSALFRGGKYYFSHHVFKMFFLIDMHGIKDTLGIE